MCKLHQIRIIRCSAGNRIRISKCCRYPKLCFIIYQAKETFEQQLKDAMLQLDDLHRELDEEQISRNELKKSLKSAAAELEDWKSQYASGALKGPSDDDDVA